METVVSYRRRLVVSMLLACCFAVGVALGPSSLVPNAPAAKAKSGVLKGNPSNKRFATEFLRLLKNEDKPGLRRFFDPAFLLQRGDGSFLTKSQYLKDPALVSAFQVRNIVSTRSANVKVVRFEAKTDQVIDGNKVPGVFIPRLSTFIKKKNVWRLISHANFLPPPTS